MSDDNWSWQVSKMTFFKRLDLVNGKREGIGSLPGLCWFLHLQRSTWIGKEYKGTEAGITDQH